MRKYKRAAGLLLVMAGLGTVACSGDSGHDRADYVRALGGAGEGFTEEESTCAAGAMVDVVGVDALEDADAFDTIQDNPDGSLSDFGITLTEAQGGELYAGLNECKDLRAFFQESLTTSGLAPDLAQCVMDKIDEPTLQGIIVTSFTEGDEGLDADPGLSATFESAGTECAAAAGTP
jgi:hypothetical protein